MKPSGNRGGEQRIPSGRIARSVPIAALALRAGGGRLAAALRRRLGDDGAVLEFHERNAARYAEALSGSKGVLMKAGQLLSFVQPPGAGGAEHWSPYQDALAALRADAEPMTAPVVCSVVEAELGSAPEAAFDEFDPEPFAAASIGQVHRARLRDGTPVAVKVQYPGAADAIAADLANAELLATMLRLAQATLPRMPQLDATALAMELRDRITEELDYRREKANQDEFAAIFDAHDSIRIPRTYAEVSADRVLTMDLVEGIAWDEALHAPQELRDEWGMAINRFFFQPIYRHGLFHADPHPGNYLFHEDGSVSFLDFGCVSRLDPRSLAVFVEIAEAAAHEDADALGDVFRRERFIVNDSLTNQEIFNWYGPTFENMTTNQPFRMTREFTARVLDTLNPAGPHAQITRAMNLPRSFALTSRIYIGLFSVLAALESENDWLTPAEADLAYYHRHKATIAAAHTPTRSP